jgi:hypothetical protein
MARHFREPVWLDGAVDLSGDPSLEAAYRLSGWAVAVLGPVFSISLIYLLVLAELQG